MAGEKQPLIVANWKMYKTKDEAVAYLGELASKMQNAEAQVFVAVPFTLIAPCAEAAPPEIVIGAQNMNDAEEGAFTGEVAAKMLLDAGARFVILGHSERRRLFGEADPFINKKVHRALSDRLQPLLCIGETLEEREGDKTEEVLRNQLTACLEGVTKAQAAQLIVAYEPVWAIGSNRSATPEMANETHALVRRILAEQFTDTIPVLYGGSVNADNASALLQQPEIDGLLIGGASLSADHFAAIVQQQGEPVS